MTPTYEIISPSSDLIEIIKFDVAHFSHGKDGRIVTYHGHITYKDIFGQEHRTEIAYLLHWWTDGDIPKSTLIHLPKYSRYATITKADE